MKAAPLILISPSFQPSGAEFDDASLSLSNNYCNAIHSAGGVPTVMPRIADRTTIAELVRRSDGVMMSGGDDVQPGLYLKTVPKALAATVHETDPDRDWIELVLIDEVFRQRKPLLPMRGLGGGVTVVTDHELMLVGKLPDAFQVGILVGNLARDGPADGRHAVDRNGGVLDPARKCPGIVGERTTR